LIKEVEKIIKEKTNQVKRDKKGNMQ